MFYSKSTGGFYDESIHGVRFIEHVDIDTESGETLNRWPESNPDCQIPIDAVEITAAEHLALLVGQSNGKQIAPDVNGYPVLTDPPTFPLTDEIAALIRQIDADADAIYNAALGNRATEYAEAESQAQGFKDAGYAGAAPAYVQAWADATGNTAQWAADSILATATAWLSAQTTIRANRLAHKEAARRAADFDALDLVKAGWTTAVQAIRAQLGIT